MTLITSIRCASACKGRIIGDEEFSEVLSFEHFYFHNLLSRSFTDDGLVDFLKIKVREIADRSGVEVVSMECDEDHFHMLFRGTPVLRITEFVNAVKTITSREIQRKFHEVTKVL